LVVYIIISVMDGHTSIKYIKIYTKYRLALLSRQMQGYVNIYIIIFNNFSKN